MYWLSKQSKAISLICLTLCCLVIGGCAVEQDPDKAAAYYADGMAAYTGQADLDTAISLLKKATKYDERNVEYAVRLIEFLRLKGKYEEAENLVNKALKYNSENIELRIAAGETYIEWVQSITSYLDQGALADQGLKHFNYVLEREPDHFDALLYRANTYANYPDFGGIHNQAEHDYLHLLELTTVGENPQYALVYYYYGEFLERNRGDRTQAVEIWQKGLELYPDNELLQGKLNKAATDGVTSGQ